VGGPFLSLLPSPPRISKPRCFLDLPNLPLLYSTRCCPVSHLSSVLAVCFVFLFNSPLLSSPPFYYLRSGCSPAHLQSQTHSNRVQAGWAHGAMYPPLPPPVPTQRGGRRGRWRGSWCAAAAAMEQPWTQRRWTGRSSNRGLRGDGPGAAATVDSEAMDRAQQQPWTQRRWTGSSRLSGPAAP
jgi:hypothetical protein